MKRIGVGFLLVGAGSAWPGATPDVCVVPATVQVRPDNTCGDFGHGSDCEAPLISIAAMRGETETVQLLLRQGLDEDTPEGDLTNVSISFPDVTGEVASLSVSRVGYVHTKHSPRYSGSGGGWRADPLLPLALEEPFDVPPKVAQALWLTFTVSPQAEPGKYSSAVFVTCGGCKNKPLHEIKVELEVWDLTLPSLLDSTIGTAWGGHWDDDYFASWYKGSEFCWNKTAYYDLMIGHRMPPDQMYITAPRPMEDYEYMAARGVNWFALLDIDNVFPELGDPPLAKYVQQGVGPLTLRYHDYVTQLIVNESTTTTTTTTPSCRNYTDDYIEQMIELLKPTVMDLERKGLLHHAYVYGFDEKPSSCEPQVRQLFGAIKRAYPKLTTVATLNWSPMPVDLPVDVWVLQYQMFNATDAQPWLDAGKQQWQYHCIEPASLKYLNTFIERSAIQSRLLFWHAARQEATYGAPSGWLYYRMNKWIRKDNEIAKPLEWIKTAQGKALAPFTDFDPGSYIWGGDADIFANGDGYFIYPCPDGLPCSSMRLSNMRDGLEDWELFSQLPPAQAADLVAQLVTGPSDWIESPQLLNRVRRQAAAAAMKAAAKRKDAEAKIV